MKMCLLSLLVIVACLGVAVSFADEPVTTPTTSSFCSISGRFCATSRAADSATIIEDKFAHSEAQIWSIKSYVPYGFISDDGAVIASCYPGENLVPDTADLNFTVVKLFDRRGRSKAILLKDLYSSMGQLPQTVSHKDWGHCVGFHGEYFEVERADGSTWTVKENW
jgi:hypothetical protein